MKHFEDLADAKEEKFGNPAVYSEICFHVTLDLRDPTFQKLLYLDVAANVVADISEAPKNKHQARERHMTYMTSSPARIGRPWRKWASFGRALCIRARSAHENRENREPEKKQKNQPIHGTFTVPFFIYPF